MCKNIKIKIEDSYQLESKHWNDKWDFFPHKDLCQSRGVSLPVCVVRMVQIEYGWITRDFVLDMGREGSEVIGDWYLYICEKIKWIYMLVQDGVMG